MTPRIFIEQHESCFYEWSLLFGHHKAGGDAGYSNIEDCIRDALAIMPDAECLIEVTYKHIHMGAFTRTELRTCSARIAGDIAYRHREVSEMLSAVSVLS